MARQNPLTRKKRDKAILALRQGRPDDAARLLEQYCQSDPADPEAWALLASIHGQQGRLDSVANLCQRALALAPAHPLANSLLGNIHALQGNHEAARACYRTALLGAPDDIGILNNLGSSLYLAGELEEAADIIGKVVKLQPGYADAHNNLGNIFKALNRNSEAIAHFQRALQLNPQLFETWINLGSIYSDRIGFPQAAEDCFRKALQLRPDSIEAEAGLANMLRFQGKLEDSLALIREALKKRPDDHSALAGEADLLERMGRHDEAYDRVNDLLGKDPDNAMAADVLTRLCRRYDCCDEAVRLAENMLADDALNDAGRQTLHFSLGKLYDKLEEYDAAFAHYSRGNAMTSAPFEVAAYEAVFSSIMQAYSREALHGMPTASHGDARPVFIIGMPRSGTSLTEQILASHPAVYGAGELNDINDIAAGLPGALGSTLPYPACIADLNELAVNELASRYLNRLDGFSRTATRITDKMPHNFMNLGLIALLFPQARIIHCRRDPRDTCLSIFFQSFGWLHPYATDLSNLGSYYRLYERLMRHWESIIDLPMLTVNYEDLVTDQERTSRELVNFIGLEWDDDCLQFHRAERTVATASYDQVRKPMYTRSMARWRNYESHIKPLVETLGDLVR